MNVRLGDYARLTGIMAKHQQIADRQREELDEFKKELYGDYFDQYHNAALENYGLFSPKSFESSSLLADFEEAILTVKPRKYIPSATFSFKCMIYFLAILPQKFQDILFIKFTNSMAQFNNNNNNCNDKKN